MLSVKDIKNDTEVCSIMAVSERQIEALGFTEHSVRHSSIVSKWSGEILRKMGCDEREIRLAEIAGYLHDIGNAVNRVDHAQSGALISYNILTRMGMDYETSAEIMMAIGNHDEQFGIPVSKVSAALIIADKADVHRSRVRKSIRAVSLKEANIHDRVNLAAESSHLEVDNDSIPPMEEDAPEEKPRKKGLFKFFSVEEDEAPEEPPVHRLGESDRDFE